MSRYHRLSIAEKRAENIANVRESPMPCIDCGMQVMPADMPAHLEQRCPGPREPGPRDTWIDHRKAVELVPRATLSRYANNGRVRVSSGRDGYRKYLYRDLLKVEQFRRSLRRR